MNAEQLMLPMKVWRLVKCSAANPDDPNHHLQRTKRGYWQLRITVIYQEKFCGKRITIGLKTHSDEKARARRDALLTALAKAGMQKSWATTQD